MYCWKIASWDVLGHWDRPRSHSHSRRPPIPHPPGRLGEKTLWGSLINPYPNQLGCLWLRKWFPVKSKRAESLRGTAPLGEADEAENAKLRRTPKPLALGNRHTFKEPSELALGWSGNKYTKGQMIHWLFQLRDSFTGRGKILAGWRLALRACRMSNVM